MITVITVNEGIARRSGYEHPARITGDVELERKVHSKISEKMACK